MAGLALVSLLVIEMYIDVSQVALGRGWVVLAFGIAIDAAARALGTIAAGRSGSTRWAWLCGLCGSPAVALYTLFGKDGPLSVEPGPIAGLLSLLALLVLAVGCAFAALDV
jgi:hypothetical protein